MRLSEKSEQTAFMVCFCGLSAKPVCQVWNRNIVTERYFYCQGAAKAPFCLLN